MYRISEKTLDDTRSWTDWFHSSTKFQRRLARVNEEKEREDVVEGLEVAKVHIIHY